MNTGIKTIFSLLFVSILALSLSPPPSTITLKFEGLKLLEGGAWGDQKFYFKVNGNKFSPDEKVRTIKIDPKSLDTLVFSYDSTFKEGWTHLTRFKAGQSYSIGINPCSQYVLVADHHPKTGQVRFRTVNNDETLAASFGSGCATDTMRKDMSKPYHDHCPSYMCYYAPVSIIFGQLKDPEENVIAATSFHFLHGEKLTATYDGKTRKITLTVDGYLK